MSIKRAILKAKTILNQNKIVSFPVDIEKIATNEGFNVTKTSLPDKVSGILEPAENNIYINKNNNEKRQRFTIAHELGHYFLNHCDGIHVDKTFRDTKSSEGLYAIEIEANNFAAELLMPKDEINSILESYTEDNVPDVELIINELSKHFNVSEEAIKNKLKNLGYITEFEHF